ncbi:MAG: hypothetical protein U0R51_10990 [Solirubrobacterales bacterium]
MAWVRTMLAVALTAPALFVAYLAWEFDGYKEDYGSPPAETTGFAALWTIATIALFILAGGSLVSPDRREGWSWWAVGLAALMAIMLVGVVTSGSGG